MVAAAEASGDEDDRPTARAFQILQSIPAFRRWRQAQLPEGWCRVLERADEQELMTLLAEILPRLLEED